MKKSASIALSFAAFSVAALCAGYFARKKGFLPLSRAAAESAAEAPCPAEAPAAQETAQNAPCEGQILAEVPCPEEAADNLSPIFEFQLVESEEIRA